MDNYIRDIVNSGEDSFRTVLIILAIFVAAIIVVYIIWNKNRGRAVLIGLVVGTATLVAVIISAAYHNYTRMAAVSSLKDEIYNEYNISVSSEDLNDYNLSSVYDIGVSRGIRAMSGMHSYNVYIVNVNGHSYLCTESDGEYTPINNTTEE